MRSFGNYLLSGKAQAIGIVSVFSVLSLLVPPLAFLFCGVPVALITLRRGLNSALQVVVGSLCVSMILSVLLNIQALYVAVMLLTVWLPVCICAAVLRATESQVKMALSAAMIAAVFVIFMYVNFADVELFWRELIREGLTAGLPDVESAQFAEILKVAAPLMNAAVASSIVLSLIMALLTARWWQAELFNPGGFGREFRTFSLPRELALPVMLGVILVFLDDSFATLLLRDLLVILLVLYMIQGIVAVHRTVNSREMSRNWLIAMYCLLLSLPQIMIVFIAWMGVSDTLVRHKGNTEEE